MKIILASASPRRNEMLRQLNIPYEKMVASTEEIGEEAIEIHTVEDIAMKNALAKAQGTADQLLETMVPDEDAIIIGADTIVTYDNGILGKPVDDDDARRMLEILSGKTHEVITGIALVKIPAGSKSTRFIIGYDTTKVTFRKLSQVDIDNYVSTGEPTDKAGAYGIQGFGVFLVDRIEGDYPNVVGLPLIKLFYLMKQVGVDLLAVSTGKNGL
jgi:septum formation protein